MDIFGDSCRVLTASRAKRYDRLLRNSGFHPNGGAGSKSEKDNAAKRKPKASIAKAAEAKRRKIEGDHNDPLADDGAPGRPLKREPGIKQEHHEHPLSMLSRVPYASGYMCQQIQGHSLPLLSAYPSQNSGSYGSNQDLGLLASIIKLEDDIEVRCPSSTPAEKSSAPDLDDDSIFEDFCTPELFTSSDQEPKQVSNADEDVVLDRLPRKGTSGSSLHDTIAARPSPADTAREVHEPESSVGNESTSPANARATEVSCRRLSAASTIKAGKVVDSADCVVILD